MIGIFATHRMLPVLLAGALAIAACLTVPSGEIEDAIDARS